VYITIKVQVFHPDTLRRTWNTWRLCEDHYAEFAARKGEGYYCWYREKGDEGNAQVIQYRIIG